MVFLLAEAVAGPAGEVPCTPSRAGRLVRAVFSERPPPGGGQARCVRARGLTLSHPGLV